MTDAYNLSVKLKGKVINYRKWKVKDKRKFLDNIDNSVVVKEALVYDCLEDKRIGLSEEEYKYILFKIRESSLSEKISFLFTCVSCGEKFNYTADLNEIMTPEFTAFGECKADGVVFEMGSVQNREFYENAMQACESEKEKYLVDFVLHVKSYNDSDGFTFNSISDVINDLDVDIFESIFLQWENMRFKINNIHGVECPHCKYNQLYEFDDLPGFFPKSWDD